MGWDCVNVWRERVMNCSCWRRRPAVRPSTRSLREPGSMRSRLVQYELDGRSLLARGHVALHSMVQEDIDHLPHGCAVTVCCLPESDVPVAVEADRILRRSERNELTRSGRLVQVLSPCDRFHGKVTLREAAELAGATVREMIDILLDHGVKGNMTASQERT